MIGHARRIRLHDPGRPLPSRDDRRHVEAMIGRVELAAQDAREAARRCGLAETVERIEWALDFLVDAAEQVKAGG